MLQFMGSQRVGHNLVTEQFYVCVCVCIIYTQEPGGLVAHGVTKSHTQLND